MGPSWGCLGAILGSSWGHLGAPGMQLKQFDVKNLPIAGPSTGAPCSEDVFHIWGFLGPYWGHLAQHVAQHPPIKKTTDTSPLRKSVFQNFHGPSGKICIHMFVVADGVKGVPPKTQGPPFNRKHVGNASFLGGQGGAAAPSRCASFRRHAQSLNSLSVRALYIS